MSDSIVDQANSPPAPLTVLYIGGVGRSGSTLVERMLNDIPGIVGVGELFQMWSRGIQENRLCSCGAPFHDCERWRAIGQHAFGGWHQLDIARLEALQLHMAKLARHPGRATVEGSPDRNLMKEFASYSDRIYRAAAHCTGANVILDSSKNIAMAHCLMTATDLQVRILHLVRDPRGVAASWIKPVIDDETGQAVPIPRFAVARCALSWLRQNHAFDRMIYKLSKQNQSNKNAVAIRLRYESFIEEPIPTIRSVLQLIDLTSLPPPNEDSFAQGYARFGELHSVSGNRMRFENGKIRLQVDEQWRSRLSTLQKTMINASCLPLMLRYGYPLSNSRADKQIRQSSTLNS